LRDEVEVITILIIIILVIVLHNDERDDELVEWSELVIVILPPDKIGLDDERHKLLDELPGLLIEVLEVSDNEVRLVPDIMLDDDDDDGMDDDELMIAMVITTEDEVEDEVDILGLHQLVLHIQLQLV
jgi:hypothetical protein